MRIGKYVFDNLDHMEAEELDALQEGIVLRCDQLNARKNFLEEVIALIKKGKEQGFQLTLATDYIWTNLSCEDNLKRLRVEDREEWV